MLVGRSFRARSPAGEELVDRVRFIADRMLGKLAKWLRILGHDARYDPHLDTPHLMRVARSENRVVLTSDTELARRKGLETLLITSQAVDDQLRHVLTVFGLSPDGPFSRCPLCNVTLISVPRDEAWGQVPSYVFVTQERLGLCPSCSRFYWRGTHWDRMRDKLPRLDHRGMA